MKQLTLPIRFGIVTCAVLIAYFLLLALLGWHTNVFFSLFNGVITGLGIYEAIKITKLKDPKGFTYQKGFSAGLVTGGLATVLFTIFFAIYAEELNPNFLSALSEVWSNDYTSFEGIVFFTVAIMGFATTIVLTLSFMQLFKPSNNPKK